MTFRKRYIKYLAEETQQTITNEINKTRDPANYTNNNDVKPTQSSEKVSDVAIASTSATVPLVRSVESINDVKGNRTSDDAKSAGDSLARESRNSAINSSRTPFNVSINESDDILSSIRGPYANNLTKRLQNVGLNTGVRKTDVSPNQNNSKTGQKNITSGTKASFTLGRKDAGKQARDNVKTAMDIPRKNDIKKATVMDSTVFFKVGVLIQEYTDMDVSWGTNAPGNVKSGRTMNGLSNTHDRTSDTHDMVKNMNNVIDDKQKVQAKNRAATMPEKETDPEHGNIMTSRNIVHGADQANADVSQQREQRLSAQAEQEQQDG